MRRSTWLLLPALLLAGCGDGRDEVLPAADPAALEKVDWQLLEVRQDGRVTDYAELDAVLRFDGAGRVSGHGCNHFGAPARVTADRVEAGDFDTTLMACTGPRGEVDDHLQSTLSAGAAWSLADGRLTLSGAGRELVLRERDAVFRSRTATPIVQGERGEAVYRLSWEARDGHVGVDWESRDRPGVGFGNSGIGRPEDYDVTYLDPSGTSVAGEGFVFVPVPTDVARADWVPADGEPVELELHDLPPARTWHLAAGFVGGPTKGGYVVTYDAAGSELMRSRVLPY